MASSFSSVGPPVGRCRRGKETWAFRLIRTSLSLCPPVSPSMSIITARSQGTYQRGTLPERAQRRTFRRIPAFYLGLAEKRREFGGKFFFGPSLVACPVDK